MSSPDGRLHVTFNGEIVNYAELRRGLAGYPYRTAGDTEVLLAAFAEWGPDSVRRLRGQFAYALLDERDQSLYLVRDRLGILPLYYYADEHVFLFASEIKALLAVIAEPAVDRQSLYEYLGGRAVRAPNTLFAGIRKLAPGTWLRVGQAGASDQHRYWTVPRPSTRRVEARDAAAELHARLTRAVEVNLVADVPVGAYLSGGLDSSLIVSLVRHLRPEGELHTFSATFGDERLDETPYARAVSTANRTTHHEVHVGAADFEETWQRLTWHRDSPISEASDVAVNRLAELAAQDVKVVLSGEGADELFAGYPKHLYARLADAACRIPSAIRVAPLTAVEGRMPFRLAKQRTFVRALAAPTQSEQREMWFAAFSRRERAALLGLDAEEPAAEWGGDALWRMLEEDLRSWLPDVLLERGDRMSMAASLELRPPFLDHELVEWAFALPSKLKVRRHTGKWILREVARRYVPPDVISRPKLGFRAPLDVWFRGRLADFTREALLGKGSFVGSELNRRLVRELLDRHQSGCSNEALRIWTLLSLEVWHRVFFRSGAHTTMKAEALSA